MQEMNRKVLLAARPEGLPKASDFEVVDEAVPEPGDGEILVRNLYLSLDPAMRGWMTDRKSYIPPVGLGEVMRGLTVGEVVRSEDATLAPGDLVSAPLGWQSYSVASPKDLQRIPAGVSPTLALGPLGMTGLTAYFGLLDVGQPKAGETVLVSAAAGAVGSVVGQIAKIKGCRVVGIAGGADKCRWVQEELGFDAAIDYKSSEDLWERLSEACPKGIDIYFDNVGGHILNTALRGLRRGGRVALCGAISQYNATEEVPGPSNYLSLLINRARMEGFIVFDYEARYAEAHRDLGTWLAEGKLHYREHVVDGLENAPEALLHLFDGTNKGKLLVRIHPEREG